MRNRERQAMRNQLCRQLRDVLHREVVAVGAETALSEAARCMRELNATRLLVCDGPKLVGLITARDLIVRATAAGLDPQRTMVRDLMSRWVICVREDQAPRQAAALMQQHNLFQLPVIDRRQHLLGVVYLTELEPYP